MKRLTLAAAVLIVPLLLSACGHPGAGWIIPTNYRIILQDGTVDPGNLKGTDYGMQAILRPRPEIAQGVASGSMTLQGKTFRGVVSDGTEKGTQPGDVGPIHVQFCHDIQNGQNIGVELNFYDAGGALLEKSHATIRQIASRYTHC